MKLNKKQKRTATIASMAALLAVVLGMGGQTFAKYITTNKVDAQTAVVAKWGYVIQAVDQNDAKDTNVDVFKSEYGTTVAADNDVVAPGTNGSIKFVINGWAEVDAKVSMKVEGEWSEPVLTFDGTEVYRPVVWTLDVNGTATKFNKISELKEAIAEVSIAYDANTQENIDDYVTISWDWAFENSKKAPTEVGYNADADTYDTYLGNKIAGVELPSDYEATTSIGYGVSLTITQVD